MLIGYARVSTIEQDTALQIDALNAAGVARIYEDKSSGIGTRPQLHNCLRALCAGDVLVVWKLDRIARSLKDLLRILDRVREAGAQIRSLSEPLDTTTPLGIFVIQVLGAVAELERGIIRERVIAGLVAAHKRGVKLGQRKINVTPAESEKMRTMWASGYSLAEIGRQFGVTGTTVHRHVSPNYKPRPKMPVLSKYM